MDVITTLPLKSWSPPADSGGALAALEAGQVLFLPALAFALDPGERALLTPRVSDGKAKNISFDVATGTLRGARVHGQDRDGLAAMMARFAAQAERLVCALAPRYRPALTRGRTSFRPCEIAGRVASPRHDDTLLHVDAFRSRPLRGQRIFRVFTNINPEGAPRLWCIGERFPDFAARLRDRIRAPYLFEADILAALGLTKGRRSAYDVAMLSLHDAAKLNTAYQASAPRLDFAFPAGSTWLCFSDQVLHAAFAGQHALEQTFYLDVAAMGNPAQSPLHVLQAMTGRTLI